VNQIKKKIKKIKTQPWELLDPGCRCILLEIGPCTPQIRITEPIGTYSSETCSTGLLSVGGTSAGVRARLTFSQILHPDLLQEISEEGGAFFYCFFKRGDWQWIARRPPRDWDCEVGCRVFKYSF